MLRFFLVFGYGVPKNIFQHAGYSNYLNTVFNRIFDFTVNHPADKVSVVFSGGKTDCFPPCKRSEAGEMKKLFRRLAGRKMVRRVAGQWQLLTQARSLSTLENLIFGQQIAKQLGTGSPVTIFCEETRKRRVRILADKIFGKNQTVVSAVDFDTSDHRFLPPPFLARRERADLQRELKALENPRALKSYRKFLESKIAYFRQQGAARHSAAILKWWSQHS